MEERMLVNKEKSILNYYKAVLLLFISVALIYFSFLSTETKLKDFLTVKIPLATDFGLGFPIPVLFWLGIFIYLIVISKLYRGNFKDLAGFGVALGFFTHFILLLLNLNTRNARQDIYWFSNAYLLYFKAFFTSALCILSIWSGILFRIYFTSKYESSYLSLIYSIPLLFLYSAVRIFFDHSYLLLSFIIVLFFISFYLKGNTDTYTKIKKKIALLSGVLTNEKVFLVLIFLASIFVRIFFLKRVMSNPNYIDTGSDGAPLDAYARRFLAGEPVGAPQAKGYWIFLAGIYYLFGTNYFTAGVIQSFFGALAVVLVYLVTKRSFGMVTARIASVISALDYLLIYSAAGICHQAMDLFYSIFIVYLLIKCKEIGINIKGIFLLALTGSICGLAMATREVNVLIPLIGSAWLIFIFLNSGYSRLRAFTAICILLLFSILGVAPFLYLNYIYSGSLYDQSSTYGVKFVLQLFNPQLTSIGFDPFIDFKGSMKIVIEKPLAFLKAVWLNYYTKFMDLYFSQGFGGVDPIFLVRKPVTNYYLSMWFYAYLVTFLGLISAFVTKIKDKLVVYLILSIILYKTAFHLFTVSVYRYRAAINPLLVIFTAYGVYLFIQFTRNKIEGG